MIHNTATTTTNCMKVETKADSLLGEKVDAVICVAGGWAGGNCAHAGFKCAQVV